MIDNNSCLKISIFNPVFNAGEPKRFKCSKNIYFINICQLGLQGFSIICRKIKQPQLIILFFKS